jgi:predicted permease
MAWFHGEEQKHELDAEIAAHLALSAADKRERGAGGEAARQEAQREFGNMALVKDVTAQAWGWVWVERLLQDLKYALRQLRKSPGFAAAVIGTLALGIGAATAMFTVVDRVLLRPLPYHEPGRLVAVDAGYVAPYLDIAAWREESRSFEGIAFYSNKRDRSFVEAKNATTLVSFTRVSRNVFSVLGVSPQFGSGWKNEPENFAMRGDEHSLVMNDIAWRNLFGADRNILGKSVRVNDEDYTVVGVMPRGFSFPAATEMPQIWAPIVLGSDDRSRTFGSAYYESIARLRPGVTLEAAASEMRTIQTRIMKEYTDPELRTNQDHMRLAKYSDEQRDASTTKPLLALTAAAGLLWLIACMNATNLLLARASVRQREIAMRGALGASYRRLMQQLMVEGLVLSGAASLLGAGLALGSILLFKHPLASHFPYAAQLEISVRVLVVLVGLTLLSALIASMWPAFLAARAPIEPVLRQGGQQSGSSRRQNRLRGGLVVAEIAMSLALLTSCGLLLRTIYALRHVPLGFRTDHILVANLDIPTYRFSKLDAASTIYEPLLERVRQQPGVDAAGLMTQVPLGHTFTINFLMNNDPGQTPIVSQFKAVSPELQGVFGFQMLRGRYFNADDTAASELVVVVNRAFAHVFAPHEQDLSKVVGMKLLQFSADASRPMQATIIGVLDDFHQRSVGSPSEPEIEVSLSQLNPNTRFYAVLESIAMDLTVRTKLAPEKMIPQIRAMLKQATPELANARFTTMDQIVEDSFGSQMLAARLLEVFAGSALLLCVAGLYGLLAYIVNQRTREMGVRFALGAQRGDVIWLIMRQAGVLITAGVVIGLGLALASGRLVRSYLYGVSAHDGWTLAAVVFTLAIFGALAAYLPARRASRVDPVEALRAE